ncbi:saccharopine dehydrogenase NADP-binding domain-containing protein [Vallitalea guaymasensis]|uniref:Saccharopine dehydrogenase NADP-binding domain-containing protein n=1 Tax=Vallitalea guaymasensis TaxID=1185412 RepID=A0A8J8SDG4_9FIRM|nr:saccharopine dehydrogenase NADP-binding domain-containing protein [Vallitalea guaymasensis]QUH30460.1 saccharopine dehydrogenase NADP-binding domain-containing protein [Vallitalea guaymasensis]
MKKEKYNTIGILGATGSVGKKAAKTLMEHTDYKLLLGSRDKNKLETMFDVSDSIKEYVQVDINNKVQLEEFCSRCSMVLNCSGPSEIILEKVALACIERGVHYVDVSGGEKLYELLKTKEDIIRSKKLLFIIACGVYPGLTEIYPKYIIKKYFDLVNSLKFYFTTQGKLSFSSAYDYICGILNKVGKGMKYIDRGCITSVDNNKIQECSLPEPAGSRYCYPIINVEFEKMCQNNNIDEAYFYNTFYNKEDIENAMLIIKDSKRLGKDVLAKNMTGQFVGDSSLRDFTMIYMTCEGIKDNSEIEIEGKMLYQGAGNDISGIVGANVIEIIMDTEPNEHGIYYVTDIISVDSFIDKMNNKGIMFYETIKEYEEGEII